MVEARSCALCGKQTSTPRSGGIVAHTLLTNALRKWRARLKAPESRYLHVSCSLKGRQILERLEQRIAPPDVSEI